MHSSASQSVPNREKFHHLAFCFLPLLPFASLALGAFYGGYWLLLPAVFLMVIVPLLDMLTGWKDDAQFSKTDFSSRDLFLLRWNPRIYAILYISALLYFIKTLDSLTGAETGFLIASMSLVGGIGFASAHELLHAREKIDQVLQRILTTFLFYPHYKLIHTRSHHTHAATDHDKNTAWLDESIYSYLFRTIPESMLRSWDMEAERISKRKPTGWARIVQNHMVAYAVGQVAFIAALYLFAGVQGLVFYFAQVVGAHVVLESVNYIQHYGLMRKREDGEYEKTGAEHSWDTYHFFSSYATYRVGHHSYHHVAVNPYYLLDAEPEAPKLPVGYFWAIPMVFVPPVWRRVINPKLTPPTTSLQPGVT